MKRWKWLLALAVLVAALGPAALAGAQKASLDPAADPNYGSWPLAEFPDPFIMTVQAGGDVDAGSADVGAGCVGRCRHACRLQQCPVAHIGTALRGESGHTLSD